MKASIKEYYSHIRKTTISFTIIILVIVSVFGFSYLNKSRLFEDFETVTSTIGTKTYTLYIADTHKTRQKGLSGTKELPQDEGLLFLFETSDQYAFWMKDMNYSIDIIYIQDQNVVDIIPSVSPDTYPQAFIPQKSANRVIELNAGEVEKNDLEIGDVIKLDDL